MKRYYHPNKHELNIAHTARRFDELLKDMEDTISLFTTERVNSTARKKLATKLRHLRKKIIWRQNMMIIQRGMSP